MSIIYDALKKTENKLDSAGTKNSAARNKQTQKPYSLYFVAIVGGLILASVTYNAVTKNYLARGIRNRSNEHALAKLGVKLTLNGIFFSEGANYALINNQIVKEGDAIMGVTVRRITSQLVEVDKNGIVARLSPRK